MPGWMWVVILIVAAGTLFAVWLISAGKKVKQWRAEVEQRGTITSAWVVDVQPPQGLMWAIALVILCRDDDVTDGEMRELVKRVRAVRKHPPADPDGAEVARVTRRQIDAPGRNRLPEGFTGGREVYSLFYDITQDDEANLPEGGLGAESFPVKLLWNKHPTILVVPAQKPRGKSPS